MKLRSPIKKGERGVYVCDSKILKIKNKQL